MYELMDKLIEALQILRKYDNPEYPTHCEHDELYIHVSPEKVSSEDIKKLDELGILSGEDCFYSFKFGSA
jgi:hypothetical protein